MIDILFYLGKPSSCKIRWPKQYIHAVGYYVRHVYNHYKSIIDFYNDYILDKNISFRFASLIFAKWWNISNNNYNSNAIFSQIFSNFICHFEHHECGRWKCNVLHLRLTCPITYTVTVVTPPIIQSSRNKTKLSDIYQSFLGYRFPTQTSF